MAVERKKKEEPGVPEWVVTFGDLMSLLLTFFILLQMFSELKREHEYQRVITAVKEAFGFSGGIGVLPIDDVPLRSIIEQLETMAITSYDRTKISQNPEEGMEGQHVRVTRVREGLKFTIGGPSTFEPYSAEVKPGVKEQLNKLAVMLKGRNNKIIIRGHAANKYLPEDSQWKDLDELSFARARNITDILRNLGIQDTVFRLEAVGTREPVKPRVVDTNEAAENRRVEVILTEELADDTNRDALYADPDLARGG